MNLLELYRLVDDKINSCISDYREHKSLDIIESDVRDLLTIYRQNELFETFNVVFEQDAFDITAVVRLRLSNETEQLPQLIPIEFRYTFNSDDSIIEDKQSMYEKLEKMLLDASKKDNYEEKEIINEGQNDFEAHCR